MIIIHGRFDSKFTFFHSIDRSLRKLNVEGNQLSGLPYSSAHALSSLTHLLIGDNLTHPLLWTENTRNQPQVSQNREIKNIAVTSYYVQALLDLCCVAMAAQKLHPQLPDMVTLCMFRYMRVFKCLRELTPPPDLTM